MQHVQIFTARFSTQVADIDAVLPVAELEDESIGAVAAIDLVVPGATGQGVVPVTRADGVVAGPAGDVVGHIGQALHGIVAGAAVVNQFRRQGGVVPFCAIGELDRGQAVIWIEIIFQHDLIGAAKAQAQVVGVVSHAARDLGRCRQQAGAQLQHIEILAVRFATQITRVDGVLAVAQLEEEGVDAGAAVEEIVASAAVQGDGTHAGVQRVVACVAVQDVARIAAADEVVAGAAVDGVRRVGQAAQGVVAGAAVVDQPARDGAVIPVRAIGKLNIGQAQGGVEIAFHPYLIASAEPEQQVVAIAAGGARHARIAACDAGAQYQGIAAFVRIGPYRVLPVAGLEQIDVVAGAAAQHVVTGAAGEHVVARAAIDHIIAGAAE